MFAYNKINNEYYYYIQLKDLILVALSSDDVIDEVYELIETYENKIDLDTFIGITNINVMTYLCNQEYLFNYNDNRYLGLDKISSYIQKSISLVLNYDILKTKLDAEDIYSKEIYEYRLKNFVDLFKLRNGMIPLGLPDDLFTIGKLENAHSFNGKYNFYESFIFNMFFVTKTDGSLIEKYEKQDMCDCIKLYLKQHGFFKSEKDYPAKHVCPDERDKLLVIFNKELFNGEITRKRKKEEN